MAPLVYLQHLSSLHCHPCAGKNMYARSTYFLDLGRNTVFHEGFDKTIL